ncbi:hypothetical protein N7541_002994 [Penicillium brevicompactum]|uniref:AMP-dependent synthetase/ligase domain-containing protein n=1 Tax=Penicillium brevicompactum TaxID=5074 RepID=A0A9W9RKZ8_PENBR|nr:hypothetical protein N7541_002994 [Penicillium brevicompactum]
MAPSLVESDTLYLQSPTKLIDCFKDAVQLELSQHWPLRKQISDTGSVRESNFLKAAWILTLRCFAPEEVISISYDEELGSDAGDSTAFTVRVESSWNVSRLLGTLETQEKANVLGAGPQISHSRSVCTAALRYITNTSPSLTAVPFLGGKPELVVINNNNQLIASISGPDSVPKQLNDSMLWTFQHVLRQILARPTSLKLEDIEYCSEPHKRRIKSLTSTDSFSSENCLHDLIVENCHRHPEKLAIRSFDDDMTYGDLNSLSLRLAYYLNNLGVRPESFVLSSFQKSTWAIVARLAILRAGGAYISIHSSNPPAYLNSVIQRTDRFYKTIENVTVVTREWLESLPLPMQSASLPAVQPFNACTVLFTSGSTGKPKAIVQEHRSYASAIRDYSRNLGLDADTRYLQYDDYAFDISNLEFLVPLILGGCCCVPGPMKTVQDLAESISTLDANIAFLTPTVAIKANPDAMKNLKTLCIGGEPLSKDLLNNWTGSSTKLINQFGMGEAAVCCAYNDNAHDPNSSPATIGRSSSGAIWIVDPSCPSKLMPIGAVGEIVIEGPHLARGYLDQDHQATDRTKPAGFMQEIPLWLRELHPNRKLTRLYRSGDLARWTHDGRIEYIGRKDTIVKLDGCRIDVIEVEHLSRKSLTSKDAIVVDLLGVIDGKEDPRLAAFLYLSDHPDNCETAEPCLKDASQDKIAMRKVAQIKEVLAISLPPYMIPTLFLLATKVPRTPSKKTDRRMIRLLSSKFYAEERKSRSSPKLRSEESQLLPP